LDGAAKSPRKSATRLDGKSARPLLGDRWLHSMKTVLSPAKNEKNAFHKWQKV